MILDFDAFFDHENHSVNIIHQTYNNDLRYFATNDIYDKKKKKAGYYLKEAEFLEFLFV